MINKKTTVARKVIAVLLVMTLLFAANSIVLGASAAGDLGTTVYLKTTETTTPYLHYWDPNGKGSDWPGVPMVSEGNDVYSYDIGADLSTLDGVIFKKDGGSGDDSKLTQNVTGITGNLYDLSTKTWSMYDTSAIKIKSYGANLDSPQYIGSKVTLFMDAEGGDGNLQYQIMAGDAILSDFSDKKSVVWEPDKAGDYTINFTVKDGSGETNTKQLSYTIKSVSGAKEPVILGATPADGTKIKTDSPVTISVQGAGGEINNKILFYKIEIKDPNGAAVNTPYYQTSNKLTFKPTSAGEYTVTMYVQSNSVNNETVSVTYKYASAANAEELPVDSDVPVVTDSDKPIVTDSDKPVVTDSDKPVVTDSDKLVASDSDKPADTDSDKPVATDSDKPIHSDVDVPDTDFGDYDGSGKTELKDAYAIQADVVMKKTFTPEQVQRCDVNHDGKISLKDASLIQQYRAGLVVLK